nr:hypothetical protein Cduv_85 [Cedratvirus duvanny]
MDSAYSLVLMQPVTERNKTKYTLFDLCVLHLYQNQRLEKALQVCERSKFSLYKVLHIEEQETIFGEFRLYSPEGQLLLQESKEGELFIYDRNGNSTLHLGGSKDYSLVTPGLGIVYESCPRHKEGEKLILEKMFVFSDQGNLVALVYSLEGKVILNYVPYGFCFVLVGEERISFRDYFATMLYTKSMNELDYYL